MKQGAILLNGTQVTKIIKNKKFKKILNNPNIKILEECNEDLLNEKYEYWKRIVNYNPEEEKEREFNLYYFKNPKTGYSMVSIYPNLDNVKNHIKDWQDYERVDVESSK